MMIIYQLDGSHSVTAAYTSTNGAMTFKRLTGGKCRIIGWLASAMIDIHRFV